MEICTPSSFISCLVAGTARRSTASRTSLHTGKIHGSPGGSLIWIHLVGAAIRFVAISAVRARVRLSCTLVRALATKAIRENPIAVRRPLYVNVAPRIARMPGYVISPARGREYLAFVADPLMFNHGEVLLAMDGHA